MSSLLTNSSALTALQALNMTQQNLATTQNQISTGLKVANASDNAAYWSIAQSLESNTGVLGAVNDSIAQSQSILGAATSALNNVITTIGSIQTALSEAENPGADIAAINTSLASLGQQLESAVEGASYSGFNLLDGSQTALNFVSGYNVSLTGVASFNSVALTAQALTGTGGPATTTTEADITDAPTIAGIVGLAANTFTASYGVDAITTTADTTTVSSVSLSGVTTTTTYSAMNSTGAATTMLGTGANAPVSLGVTVVTSPPAGLFTQGSYNLTSLSTTPATAAAQMTAVGAALTAITSYSSIIGSTSNTLANAATFNTALSDNYTTGIGALVDADMNQASTRLQALQTQQQLGVQSLSIANQNSQLILKLFQ
jgi:flagellin